MFGNETADGNGVRSLLAASPLLFGVPVVLGIVISVIHLVGTAYPDLAWATTINSDAETLYLGHTIYQNPADGYTGMLYTPLFPTLVSLLLHIHLWNGWAPLVTIGATVSLIVLAARIAYSPTGSVSRIVRVVSAAGMGCVAYWCESSLPPAELDEGTTSQLAWAFALFGLVAVADLGPTPSRRRVVSSVLLLSAALWTKQTTIVVPVVAVVWVWVLAFISALRRSVAWQFTALLGGVNLVLLLVLNLLTDGWEFYINFEMGSRHALFSLYSLYITEGFRGGVIALGVAVVIWLACATSVVKGLRHSSVRARVRELNNGVLRLLVAEDPTGRRILLMGVYLPLGCILAVYAMRKQGSAVNEFIGVVWVLGLLAAAGWRVAQRHAGSAVLASGCISLCFGLTQLAPIRDMAARASVVVPDLERTVSWPEIPVGLRAWARDHTLYLPDRSDLNVPNGEPPYQSYANIADLLAAGEQPLSLVHALLDRHFDDVEPFPLPGEEEYTSAYGKSEEGYIWKLDEVIAARYVAEPGLPPGLLGRRPGPEQAVWMRDCFGPFAIGAVSFRIHRGGGFWCSSSPGSIRLVRTPSPFSEVVTTQPVHIAGSISMSLAGQAPAEIDLTLGTGNPSIWAARVVPVPGSSRDLAVVTYLKGAPLREALVPATRLPGGRLGVELTLTPANGSPGELFVAGRGKVQVSVPSATGAFAVIATSGAALDLKAMILRH